MMYKMYFDSHLIPYVKIVAYVENRKIRISILPYVIEYCDNGNINVIILVCL